MDLIRQVDEIISHLTKINYILREPQPNLNDRVKNILKEAKRKEQRLLQTFEEMKKTTIPEFIKKHQDLTSNRQSPKPGNVKFHMKDGVLFAEIGKEKQDEPVRHDRVAVQYAQVGGGETTTYIIPPDSELYRKYAIELNHNKNDFNKKHPEFIHKVFEDIDRGEITPIKEENPLPLPEPQNETKPQAYDSAKNPNIIRHMLIGITRDNPEKRQQDIIEKYNQMVELCRPDTALALIKAQLASKKIALPQTPPSAIAAIDKQILEALGWDKSENTLLFNAKIYVTKNERPAVVGLFSMFCYHERKFAHFMFPQCQTDYSCMLNWIIIIAVRLVNEEPEKYTNEQIIELIQNLHKTLFGDIFAGSSYFVSMFVSEPKNTTFYAESVKKLMSSEIFNYVTLQPFVIGIKEKIQAMSETKMIDPRLRKTNRLNGGTMDVGGMRDNVTRKHRHDHHDVKNTRKYKTRRTKT
jgi:hypothetical protein